MPTIAKLCLAAIAIKSVLNRQETVQSKTIWAKIKETDGIVFAIPTCYGMPSALFKALIEREQGILDWVTPEFRDLDGVWKEKSVAIIVVSNGGGENVKHIVLAYFPYLTRKLAEVFSYRKYGTAGCKGALAQNNQVITREGSCR